MRKSRPRKALRERNKLRCIYCKKELLDAIEILDGVCYYCTNNPNRRERYKLLNSQKAKEKQEIKNGK